MDCQIGPLSIRVVVAHEGSVESSREPGFYHSEAGLPGPWNTAPYGAPYHSRSQLLTAVEADISRLEATADLTVTGAVGEPTAIDLFVSALQLGQLLLYRLDEVDRAGSSTLWMRRTVLEPVADLVSGRFAVTLDNASLLPAKQGTWRSVEIVSTYGRQRLRCSVAHLLPGTAR
jgi:hypothetical protein